MQLRFLLFLFPLTLPFSASFLSPMLIIYASPFLSLIFPILIAPQPTGTTHFVIGIIVFALQITNVSSFLAIFMILISIVITVVLFWFFFLLKMRAVKMSVYELLVHIFSPGEPCYCVLYQVSCRDFHIVFFCCICSSWCM